MFHKKISQLRSKYIHNYTPIVWLQSNQVTKQTSLTSEEQSGVSEMAPTTTCIGCCHETLIIISIHSPR